MSLGLVMKILVRMSASHIIVPGSAPESSFLVMKALEGNR